MPPEISVCVASFRRPQGLARLLDSLAKLQLPERVEIEIVVVDNDAAGRARSEVEAHSGARHPVRWFVEPEQNIALARNRGVSEASGRWVAFIDDDEIADENWLVSFWEAVSEGNCDGVFGPVLPRLEEVVTPWLDVERFYSRPRHPSGTPIDACEASTSNALVRRDLLLEHRFDPAYGRSGGEDADAFRRMLGAGARFTWCDEALVCEIIPRERHRLGWLSQRAFRDGVVSTRIAKQRPGAAALWGLPRALLALGVLVPALLFASLRERAAAARIWLRICLQAGHLWAFAGLSYEEYGPRARRRRRA